MASSSSSLPVSSLSSQLWKYHVFLSFRGEDTRKTFVDHFYTALVQRGILTYKDDETLPRGESIGPSLVKAIEESQIAVIIFSKNYADSSWCLDELVHIMKCKDTRGQIVMPIFYDVDPSEVRKQKRKYGEAFGKHELENKTKVESWRKALVDASNISGWELKHIANGHESKGIKEIVDTISHTLHPITSSVDDNLIGVKARMQDLILKAGIGLGGVRMIGIWGIGGGGKTTLASSIYDEVSCKFDGCCFIKDVREKSHKKSGLEKLQAKFLSGILKQEKVRVERVEEGRRLIKDRLHHRKVLVVLDDVDKLNQLEELAGSRDWFGEGSRIIITTRDEHVLTGHRVDVVHDVSLLNNDEAMKLFCQHAPPGHSRIEDYEQLSKDVVSYAGGLPLALRVLGRFLSDKNINEWRNAWARLKAIPNDNRKILEVLKISFDGLDTIEEKQLFLDIACFFRGGYKEESTMMLFEACRFYPVIGIKVLVQKALITITEDEEFEMHDLVQEMAHYIVRGEHPNNPDKHTRIWKKEDIEKLCAMDATTTNLDKVEAIDIIPWWVKVDAHRILQVADNMKNLRWIDLNFDVDEFHNLPLAIMPKKFPPTELCFLKLKHLNAKQLWEGYKLLPNLRIMELHDLKSLIKTPHFGGLQNLERFVVKYCLLLEEIHSSFGDLENLVYVHIECCGRLEMLPPVTRSMKLMIFKLVSCESVFKHSNIKQSTENCLPHNMNNIGLRFSSECLSMLVLSGCQLADKDFRSLDRWEFPNLQELDLGGNYFVRLNFSLLRLPRLKWLDVSANEYLVELSELPSSIAVLIADECWSLKTLGDISKCKWLWKVSLRRGNRLGPFSGDILLKLMLQGNAKDYFISISVTDIDIWRGPSVVWFDNRHPTYNIMLQHNWHNDFSGILVFAKLSKQILYHSYSNPCIDISIKHGVENDFQCELGQESDEAVNEDDDDDHHHHPHDDDEDLVTCVGYVSFSSLRRTGFLNPTYNIILFSADDSCSWSRAVLVPKDDPMQTTKATTEYSEFWDEEKVYTGKTFAINHRPDSSIRISWQPILSDLLPY